MKKKILLFTSALALVSALTMSYSIGPAAMNSENRTGADGGVANCSNGSCHSGGAYAATVPTITFYEGVDQVATWEPGHTYNVVIQSPTTAPKCGFQVSASYNDGSFHPAGVFDATNAATHDTVINGYSIVEHNNAITILGNQSFIMNMQWTAPANIIVDTLYFYCTLNMVNGDGLQSGDNSTHFSQKMGCKTLSVAQLNADIKINAYPNPLTDKLNISIDNADKGVYTISVFDMHGKMVSTQTANVNKSFSTSVNASSWAAGMYHVQLKKDDAQRTIAVVKQ